MSRAINGSAPFFPTMLGGAVLVGMHWLLGVLAYHSPEIPSRSGSTMRTRMKAVDC